MCREDKGRYKGFSKCKKKEDLVTFIVNKQDHTIDELSDIGEALESMFQEPLSAFELNNELFRARPTREELDEKILEVTKKTKLLNVDNSVIFETHDDEEYGLMYSLYKHKYFKKHKNLGKKGEMILFHGTDEKNISDILVDDFSLTVRSSHGQRHGKGIYFTNCIDKALHYSEKMGKKKYVFVCLVHVGNIMVGGVNTGIHPKIPGSNHTYDTSCDNLKIPIQFVKKKNGCYNILGVLKFYMKERVDLFPRGGASGPPKIYPIGTKVEILALVPNMKSLKGRTGVTESSRFAGGNAIHLYRVVIDDINMQGLSKSTRTYAVPEFNLRRIQTPVTQPAICQVINDTDEDIKIYWIPKHINIYDPVLDIRQHGKIMGNISKGMKSSFRTYKDEKFICASSFGYIRIIEMKSNEEIITIT